MGSGVDSGMGSSGVDSNYQGIVAFMSEIDEEVANRPVADNDSDVDFDDLEVDLGDDPMGTQEPKDSFPEEERSTHFLAIRITERGIVEQAKLLQDHIVEKEPVLSECCMKSGLFHVTLGMLRLANDEGIREAMEVMEDLGEILREYRAKHPDFRLKIEGMETFGQRVLYGVVKPEPKDVFWEFISVVANRIATTSPNIVVTNKFEFTPHLTVLKINRPISRLRNSKYIPGGHYQDLEGMTFGVQPVNNLQLCVIEASTRFDGFYRTLNEITV